LSEKNIFKKIGYTTEKATQKEEKKEKLYSLC